VWLPWRDALKIAVVLVMAVACLRRVRRRGVVLAVATAKEAVHCLVLYTIWQFTREHAITKVAGAHEHALWVWRLQRSLHLPSEAALQSALIDNELVMRSLNVYYGGVHVPAMGIVLVWLFFRHRHRYAKVRTTLALLTAGCLSVQMIPLAPPRFFPELGFVDAAILYNQSVYGTGGSGISNQLAAMPSLHVGWSILVALAAVRISGSRWRWLVVLHPVVTVVSVTVTANHWWLDGVAAAIILGAAILVRRAAAAALMRVRLRRVVDEATRTAQEAGASDAATNELHPAVVATAAAVPLASLHARGALPGETSP
jgi:hypothetical protein